MAQQVNNHTITIGLTTYNAEATISAAIESALVQSYPASQIILVDDSSTDQTLEIVATYSCKDQRFLVLENTLNSGVAFSRNRIIEHASGEFLAFFDDDDISDPQRLALQLERILRYEQHYANGELVLCHTAREQLYSNGLVQIEPALGHIDQGRAPAGLEVARHALMGELLRGGYGACATCSQMARTSTYRQLGGFDPEFRRCSDFELAIRHARAGGHFPGLPNPLVHQTMTATSEKSLATLEGFSLMVFEKHRDLFIAAVEYSFCCNWIRLKYSLLAGQRRRSLQLLLSLLLRHPILSLTRLYRSIPNIRRTRSLGLFYRDIKA